MTLQRKVLIQFAHPNIQRSRVNRSLLAQVEQLPHVTVNKLYEASPDFLHAAGLEHAKILVVAIDDREGSLKIISTSRQAKEELEKLFEADELAFAKQKDDGWD